MSPRNGRLAKAGLAALEIAGVFLAVAAAAAGFLAWRIQSGPVSLSAFRASAEFAIERALPENHSAQLGAIMLARGSGRDEFKITVADAAIRDDKGAPIVALPQIDAVFAVSDLAQGAFGPRILEFEKPVISFSREDGAIKADAAGFGDFDIIRLLNDRAWLRDSFQRAEFRNAVIVYKDKPSGRSWRSEGAAASLRRTEGGFDAQASGRFETNSGPASLSFDATYVEARRLIEAELRLADAPVADILGMFYGERAAFLQAPVSGAARISMTDKGVVLSSTIDLKSGAGTARIGGRALPVDLVSLKADFNPKTNAFDGLKLGFAADGSSGEIGGRVALGLADDKRSVREVEFALHADDLTLNPRGVFAVPLTVSKASVEGAYDAGTRQLSLRAFEAGFLDVTLKGSADVRRSPAGSKVSPGVRVDLAMAGALDSQRVARGWPLKLAPTVRDFIDTRLPLARVENLKLVVDLPQGALGPGKYMPDEALALTFDVSGATAIFSPGMTPLSDASASAHLSGNRFMMSGAKGRVGAVPVSDGLIDFTRLAPKGAPVNYTFSAEGNARDFLKVLNEEPVSILKTTKLKPEQFSGKARARITITRPNLRMADRSAYGYDGVLQFENVTVSEFFRGVDLEKASGKIDLKPRFMRVGADAAFGGAPLKIEWLQRFYDADGPSNFEISGEVDSTTGDVFGVPTRQMLRGPVKFKAIAVGDLGAIKSLSLDADFTRAALTLEDLNWRKPPELRAVGRLEAAFAPEGVEIKSATLDGEAIAMRGKGSFSATGALQSADVERFYLGGAADLALAASRSEDGALRAEVTGAFLNAGPMIERAVSGPKDPARPDRWKGGLDVHAKLDELALRGGARFRNAALELKRREQRLERLEFSAETIDGKPVNVTLTPADEKGVQVIETRSEDLGALFAGLFDVTSIRGGAGAMTMRVSKSSPDAPNVIEGRADARDMRVVKAPLLARLFAAGSFDGLSDLLNGEGIDISKATAEFVFRDGVVAIKEGRATGPSIGITGEGEITARKSGEVSLRGAVAPAYQLNSFLGKTPLVGDIFVNRKGEGLMALSYSVSGTAGAPTVTVNPLSALTPGLLRRMFEGRDELTGGETPAN